MVSNYSRYKERSLAISYPQSKPPTPRKVYNLQTLIDSRYKVKNMLPLEVSSGPKAEKFDLDSYLIPLFKELKWLGEGIPAYDANTNMYFSLKAFICLVTGDTPAISKLFQLSGHTGTYPC